MINGRGGLGIPIAPRFSAIRRDHGALVGDCENQVGIVRTDPDSLIVVPTGRSSHGGPAGAAVLGAPHDDRRAIDHVFVFGIDGDGREIAAADPAQRPRIGRRGGRVAERCGRSGHTRTQSPVRAAVARLVEADGSRSARGIHGRHHRIDHLRIAPRERDVRLEHGRQAVRELRPGRATVGGLVNPARTGRGRVGTEGCVFPERLLLLPERCVDCARITGVDPHLVGARVFVLVQHLGERSPAVSRAVHPALGVGPVGMAECRDEQPIGIGRIDVHVRDHLGRVEAEVGPRVAGVVRPVHAHARREIRPDDAGAGTDVDDVGCRGRDGDRADRAGRFVIEERLPVVAVVARPPDAAVIEADVEDRRTARRPGERAGAAGPEGADRAPA